MDTLNDSQITLYSPRKVAILIVYAHYPIANYEEKMVKLKEILMKEFVIKDLGVVRYFLGIEVARLCKYIFVSQCNYALDLLKETEMVGSKPAATPMDSSCKVGVIEGSSLVDKGRYQRFVGKLVYLFHTRLDIGFSVSVVS